MITAPRPMLDDRYIAGVLDVAARISVVQTTTGTELPDVAISSPDFALLDLLAQWSGVTAFITHRTYDRHRCAEHCKSAHQHVVSRSGRWNVKGAKATIILAACEKHMHLQRDAARDAIKVGLAAPFKLATVRKMVELGWELPEGMSA